MEGYGQGDREKDRPTRHLRTLLLPIVCLIVAAPAGAAPTETPVRVTSGVEEFRPSVTSSYMAWDQNRPPANQVNVIAQATGGQPIKVNKPGTSAFMGALDGSRLVFEQHPKGRDSDLVLVDLATGVRIPLPTGVNTPKEEFEPSMDGDWVAFVRAKFGTIVRASLWLVRLSTGELRKLDSVEHDELPLIAAGHVNGNFVTWFRCVGRGFPPAPCDVFRYDIITGTTVQVPNPARRRDL